MSTTLIGQPVITWGMAGTYAYGGPSPDPGSEQTHFSFAGVNGLNEHFCDPDRVAPADLPLPDADPRLAAAITKHPRKPAAWLAGPWELALPGGRSFHKTKREATETGLRRLAIADWQAAHGAQEVTG